MTEVRANSNLSSNPTHQYIFGLDRISTSKAKSPKPKGLTKCSLFKYENSNLVHKHISA